MAAFLALRSVRRKQKQCRQENPLQRPENELIYEYRLNKAVIMELCDLLREDLKPTLCSSRVLTVEQQVLISLKLLASGSFQSSAKDNINVAQSTVSCTLSRFMDSLLSKKKEFRTVFMLRKLSSNSTCSGDFQVLLERLMGLIFP